MLVDTYSLYPSRYPYDIIVCDPVESCGLLGQNILRDLRFALEMMSDQKRVLVVPSRLSLMLAAMECVELADQVMITLSITFVSTSVEKMY